MNARGILVGIVQTLATISWIGAGCYARADEPASAADQVRQILEIGWKSSPENYAAAKQHYQQAKIAAPADVRIPYAMALVALQNYQSKDAGEYLTEAVANGKPVLPIRRVKFYLDVLEKNKEAAAADLKEMIRLLAAADPSQIDAQDTARCVGRVVGYLKGPGSGQLSPENVTKLEAAITDNIKGPLSDAYAAGASQTANQYAQLQQQLSQAHQDAKVRNETKLEKSRKQNVAALAEATQNRASAEDTYNKLKESYSQEAATKNGQLDQAQRDFANLNVTITQMQNLLSGEQQKRSDQQNTAYITQLQNDIQIAGENQRKLDQQARDIRAWFMRRAAEDRSMQRDLKKAQVLEDALTRKSNDLEKAKVTDNDASTTALENKANSLKTYADIELDQ